MYLSVSLALVAIAIAIYYYISKKLDFFEKHGIPQIPAAPIIGNMGPVVAQKCTMHELLQKHYDNEPDAKYVGFYEFTTPVIMLRDMDLIKAVAIKNFEHFQDHRQSVTKETDPIFANVLFNRKGDDWKHQRTLLTASFTSSKLKDMFHLMSSYAAKFTDTLAQLPEKDREMEMKNLLTMYTNDVIASCVYGYTIDTVKEPKNIFYVYGKIGTSFATLKKSLILLLQRNFPKIAAFFNIKLLEPYVAKFFTNVVIDEVKNREEHGYSRPDFLQQMMEIQQKKDNNFSIENMVAHTFTFFFGGLDSVSTQASLVTQMLVEHPEVQVKVQQEIDVALEKTNGEFTYEVVRDMKYLEAVITETMRFYPVLPNLDRVCMKKFELPPALPGGKPFTVEPGMDVWIPVMPIHMNPDYYENPENFEPERFMDDGKKLVNSCMFLSFGAGPRMCIGSRFAMIKMKVLLCYLLAKFDITAGSKTQGSFRLKKGFFNLVPENGYWMRLEPRKNPHPSFKTKGIVNGTSNGVCAK
ncbi:cytochrome P450 9e2-like [Ceratina calcarata]|uniref:Cytochrome P450 9e2-like n=1 Tax=Ceratina calcarata TaxID=156304 RepID=A0AAJ7J8B3_9HYME|nr:cytochrome P450 9e2-like [Ceratina calcarata]